MRFTLYADGACSGNGTAHPRAGAGWVVNAETEKGKGNGILKDWMTLTQAKTNNEAEYAAVKLGLRAILDFARPGQIRDDPAPVADSVIVRTDSELVVRQLNGDYEVRAPHLRPLHDEIQRLLGLFARYQVEHIPREQNAEADRLAKKGAATP